MYAPVKAHTGICSVARAQQGDGDGEWEGRAVRGGPGAVGRPGSRRSIYPFECTAWPAAHEGTRSRGCKGFSNLGCCNHCATQAVLLRLAPFAVSCFSLVVTTLSCEGNAAIMNTWLAPQSLRISDRQSCQVGDIDGERLVRRQRGQGMPDLIGLQEYLTVPLSWRSVRPLQRTLSWVAGTDAELTVPATKRLVVSSAQTRSIFIK